MTTTPLTYDGLDLTDPAQMEKAVPHDAFKHLRETAPVIWVEQEPEARAGFLDTGYWAVTKHADVAAISKNSKDFSTQRNGVIVRFSPEMTRDQVELQGAMLIHHDPPSHTAMRQVISRGFTPRAIAAIEGALKERADKIVEAALAKGSGNFVEDLAAELPLQAIAELLGVPQEDRGKLFDWSNQMLAYDDPEVEGDEAVAAAEILGYAMMLADDRRKNPKDDIITKLVTVGEDGEGALTDDEFGFFVILLAVAGNETTRNAITHGMQAFFENPEQWELYKKERPATAVDEIIRWATPVTVFQRTAINDVEVGDVTVKEGDRVLMFYSSANFDEDVFENPFDFNILRENNPHVAFGGHGAHYCIGANLARREVDLMFNAIADKMPNLKPTGEIRRLRSGWINGVKELHANYS
ncbi:cytochrome P450 [Nocardioides sp. Bht2]|uniref:cytochrome P450 n=1 Tax=Nocardioides sp. Bht2 TaxID=3392297 RepID=UPI0039B3BFE5